MCNYIISDKENNKVKVLLKQRKIPQNNKRFNLTRNSYVSNNTATEYVKTVNK